MCNISRAERKIRHVDTLSLGMLRVLWVYFSTRSASARQLESFCTGLQAGSGGSICLACSGWQAVCKLALPLAVQQITTPLQANRSSGKPEMFTSIPFCPFQVLKRCVHRGVHVCTTPSSAVHHSSRWSLSLTLQHCSTCSRTYQQSSMPCSDVMFVLLPLSCGMALLLILKLAVNLGAATTA